MPVGVQPDDGMINFTETACHREGLVFVVSQRVLGLGEFLRLVLEGGEAVAEVPSDVGLEGLGVVHGHRDQWTTNANFDLSQAVLISSGFQKALSFRNIGICHASVTRPVPPLSAR